MRVIFKILLIVVAVLLVVGCVMGVIGLITKNVVLDEMKVYDELDTVTSLDMEVSAGEIFIKRGDALLVESNLKYLEVKVERGVLEIEDEFKRSGNYDDAVLTLYIPDDMVFTDADITTGAGRLVIESLSASDVGLELGAGEVVIDELYALSEAEIEGGAGRVTVNGGALKDLDLDMGVGEFNLKARVSGKSNIAIGVGETNITLLGAKDSYTVNCAKGMGAITVDGENVSQNTVIGSGDSKIDVTGGIGALNISFEE